MSGGLSGKSFGGLDLLMSWCRNAAGALVAAQAAHRHSPKPQKVPNCSVNEPTTSRHERPAYAFSTGGLDQRVRRQQPYDSAPAVRRCPAFTITTPRELKLHGQFMEWASTHDTVM